MIVILSFHVRRGLPSVPIFLGFPSKIFYAFPLSSNLAKCPFDLTLLGFIAVIKFGKDYKLLNLLCNILQYLFTAPLPWVQIFLSLWWDVSITLRSGLHVSNLGFVKGVQLTLPNPTIISRIRGLRD
jgi:hypothetical protein